MERLQEVHREKNDFFRSAAVTTRTTTVVRSVTKIILQLQKDNKEKLQALQY